MMSHLANKKDPPEPARVPTVEILFDSDSSYLSVGIATGVIEDYGVEFSQG